MDGRPNSLHKHLPLNCIEYRSIVPEITRTPWFCNSNLSRFDINSFVWLRFDHNRLPAHDFYFGLHSVSFCPCYFTTEILDLFHLLFHYPNLSSIKLSLLQFLSKQI